MHIVAHCTAFSVRACHASLSTPHISIPAGLSCVTVAAVLQGHLAARAHPVAQVCVWMGVCVFGGGGSGFREEAGKAGEQVKSIKGNCSDSTFKSTAC